MFGLTFDKLMIIGIIAVFLVGPERLPQLAGQLARLTRSVRNFANGARDRVREEMGPDFDDVEWQKLDPRQYDPRRIIRDALLEEPGDKYAEKPVSSPMDAAAASLHEFRAEGGPAPFDSEAT